MLNKKSIIIITIPVVLLIISLFVVFGIILKGDEVYISGTVEATTIDVAAKIPGRVDSVWVKEGTIIKKGTVLATLTGREIIAKLGQTKGQVETAKYNYQMAINGAREEEKRGAENIYLAAKHQFELASKTRDRMLQMFKDSLISQQQMDQTNFAFNAARDQMEAAKSQYDMAISGTRVEKIKMAEGMYNTALSGLDEVEAYKDELRLLSPIDGEIQKRIVDPGEVVAAGYPIFTILDLSDSWVVLQVKETDMAKYAKGSKHIGTVPALGNAKEEFEVTFIAPMGEFANWRPTNQKGSFDVKTFEIRLRPVKQLDNLRPGMSVLFPAKAGK